MESDSSYDKEMADVIQSAVESIIEAEQGERTPTFRNIAGKNETVGKEILELLDMEHPYISNQIRFEEKLKILCSKFSRSIIYLSRVYISQR